MVEDRMKGIYVDGMIGVSRVYYSMVIHVSLHESRKGSRVVMDGL